MTGASRGIGAACATVLARAGAPVVVNHRASRDEAGAVVERIVAAGGRAVAVQADVTAAADVERLAAAAEAQFGAVGIVVANAAAPNDKKPFLETSWDDFQRQLDASVRQAFLLAHAFLPGMVRHGSGRFVALGSTQALAPTRGSHAYATAKAALPGLIRTLAAEFGGAGVTANVVVAGFTRTERAERVPADVRQRYEERTPLGRLAAPEDVAHAVAYLASQEACYVTGATHVVDGGHAIVG